MTSTQLRTKDSTRTLLTCGVIAGPLYLAVGLAQAITRDGFDLRKHPFSMLSLGEGGWIQITNFIVSGLLFLACAVGVRRALPGSTWGPLLYGGIGAGLIGGGVFLADPALGFPAGAPSGSPEVVSWHSNVHFVAFVLGFGSLVALFFVLARRFAADGKRGWMWYSLASAVAFLALGAIGMVVGDFRIVTVAVVVGWGWASAAAWQLGRYATGLSS
jgi:hypothetical protein